MSPTLVVRVVPLALGLLSAIGHWFIPRLTRPDLYFAVTVGSGFRDSREGRRILRRYRRGLVVVSVPALTLLAGLALTSALPLAPLALLVQLGAYFAVFYRTRRLVRPHAVGPTQVREAQLAQRHRGIPGGWAVAAGPFVLLAACAGYLYLHWSQLPARVALHFNFYGQPDRWATRAPDTVFLPVITAAIILATMTLLLYGMAHWLRPIYPGGLRGEHESRFRKAASILLLALEYWIAVLFSWLVLRPLLPASFQHPPAATAMLPGLVAVVVVGVTAALMWSGQGGSRLPSAVQPESDSAIPVGDRTEDRFWKLGIFYFNRGDPSVMVEKRFGIGYTVNFAHPVAWVILLLPVLAVIAITTMFAAKHAAR